jgi:probable HAF family extracellular repeat protein
MMSFLKRPAMLLTTLIAVTLGLDAARSVEGGKPKGGGSATAYLVTDLGGLSVNGTYLDTQAYGLTNPDADGVVQVAGYSHVVVTSGFTPWHAYVWSATDTGAHLATNDLGTLPGNNSSYANGINDDGVVVGYNFHNPYQAFVDLPSLGMLPLPHGDLWWSTAFAVNNFGTIVGQGGIQGGVPAQGLLWQVDFAGNVSGPIDLGAFLPSDINGDGIMVGQQTGAPVSAIVDENGDLHVQPLGVLPGYATGTALAINSFGEIVGECRNSQNSARAVSWPAAGGPVALSLLANTRTSSASDINDAGQIVGWSTFLASNGSSFSNGMLWQNGTVADINKLAGLSTNGKDWHVVTGNAINNIGQIAGVMKKTTYSADDRAVLLTRRP